ncbi:hypothetical protein [Granulicella sp. L60]|uniref:hypothetical protein n=1 Tax=Granulicella sp. L60 TaxID=1641866 RepID=UPI00131E86F7|nr:hypothetical protein [Granulicella sp. L60]
MNLYCKTEGVCNYLDQQAGIGVCLKPQELLVLIAFELFLAVTRRSLRRILSPKFIAFVLTGVLYLAVMRVFAPRYQTETVPILLHTYWAFGSIGAMHLALTYKATTLSIFVTLFACYALRRRLKGLYILFALLTCAIGASIAYDIQNKDWYYHLLPCRQFVMLALSWLVLELVLPLYRKYAVNLRLSMLAASALVLVELVTLTANLRATSVSHGPTHPKTLDLLLSQYPPSTTVYIFSTSVMPFGTAVSHDLNWGSRFAHLWMLSAIVQNEQPPVPLPAGFKYLPPDTLASLATLQRTESAEDLNRWKPDVVIVEHCTPTHLCQGLEDRNFDFLSWFLQSPDFAAAWSPYKRQPGPPLYDVYFRTH